MPHVGKKKFAYDEKGMKAAREESKKTGKDMVINYDEGGMVDDYQDLVKKKDGGMLSYGHGGMTGYGKNKKK
tara:strand:+ start:242 stop:457 length:216 start_codon:yes stop_codon:yes gene_type:complete